MTRASEERRVRLGLPGPWARQLLTSTINTKDKEPVMTTTVDIATIDPTGAPVKVLHAERSSIRAALRIVDGNAPACVNRHVRERIHRDLGGELQIGMVSAEIAVYA